MTEAMVQDGASSGTPKSPGVLPPVEFPQKKIDAMRKQLSLDEDGRVVFGAEGVYADTGEAIEVPEISEVHLRKFFRTDQQVDRGIWYGINVLREYLEQGRIITDNFNGDHEARIEWRRKYTESAQRDLFSEVYLNHNKMRVNVLTRVTGCFELIESSLEESGNQDGQGLAKEIENERTELMEKIHGNKERGIRQYDELTNDEKRKVVAKFDEVVTKMLNTFAADSAVAKEEKAV